MTIAIPEKSLPTVAIVGRTNVGKSTLFNRLIERKKALVSPIAGTTRTSNVDVCRWRGIDYRLIDTGGVDFDKTNILEQEIRGQVKKAFKETDLIIFLVDLQSGLLPQEKMWAKELRQLKIPVLLVGNKADKAVFRQAALDQSWLSLGLGAPTPISAANGSGTGDLLDSITTALKSVKKKAAKKMETPPISVSILGRPNVGKSSLFNALIGEERVIISPIAHTTRESHDTLILLNNEPFLFVDTAGLRRQSKRVRGLETEGTAQTENSLENSDIALLLLDATEPFTAQDKDIVGIISGQKRKGLIVVVNKWDLIADRYVELQIEVRERIFALFPPLRYAPVVFVSAQNHENVHKIFPLIKEVQENRKKTIETIVLDEFLKKLIRRHLPVRGKGVRHPKIYSIKQVATEPPTFEISVKQKTSLHDSYLRFIENNLREEFGLIGTPVIVYVRKARF